MFFLKGVFPGKTGGECPAAETGSVTARSHNNLFPGLHTGTLGFLLGLLLLCSSNALPQKNYFYFGRDYGSDANFTPLQVLLNGSYDIMQLEDHKRDVYNFPYKSAWNTLWKNIGNPFHSIKIYGTRNFLNDEVLPFDFRKNHAQWWPNYQLHLIGGGMTYAALEEWYAYHHYPQPTLLAITTTFGYHLLNETIEIDQGTGITIDPISDIYIFDLGGILLFTSDKVKEFFSSTLNLRDWSLQPSFSAKDGHLHNNGQYFEVKWFTPWSDKLGVFYYFGVNGLTGVTYKLDDEYSLSGGGGLRAKKNVTLDASVGRQTVQTVGTGGLFIDRNNSLLGSLFVSGLSDYTVLVNIYPGIINLFPFSTGCWVAVSEKGQLAFGVNILRLPGVGYAAFR